MSYVKLVPSLLTSTIWAESPATKLTWITMLVLADRDGLVPARAPGIARAAGLTVEEVRTALDLFRAPDPDSTSQDYEGRRIEDTPDGILILNYPKYRDTACKEEREEKARIRAKRAYDKKKARGEDVDERGPYGRVPCPRCPKGHGSPEMVAVCAAESEAA